MEELQGGIGKDTVGGVGSEVEGTGHRVRGQRVKIQDT